MQMLLGTIVILNAHTSRLFTQITISSLSTLRMPSISLTSLFAMPTDQVHTVIQLFGMKLLRIMSSMKNTVEVIPTITLKTENMRLSQKKEKEITKSNIDLSENKNH